MAAHAAFLRGVNLGPRRRVSSEELRAVFEGIGFEDVASFRTSGNVVFSSADVTTGESYTVTTGSASTPVTAGEWSGGGMGGGMGGGRRDGAVQVGGHNVYPERIRRRLLEHLDVAEAAVRMDAATGRLKAFVVPRAAALDRCTAKELDTWCAVLRDVERPRPITIGAAVPLTSMGKLADW